MKCSQCGNELNSNERYCRVCGTPVQPEAGLETGEVSAGGEPPKPKKKTGLIIGVVAAAAVAVGGLVFAMNQKDPKEIVVEAFENISPEGQVSPMEELFGMSTFAEKGKTADAEASMTIVMDSCSDSEVNQFSGSGFRITGKYDQTNKRGYSCKGQGY